MGGAFNEFNEIYIETILIKIESKNLIEIHNKDLKTQDLNDFLFLWTNLDKENQKNDEEDDNGNCVKKLLQMVILLLWCTLDNTYAPKCYVAHSLCQVSFVW